MRKYFAFITIFIFLVSAALAEPEIHVYNTPGQYSGNYTDKNENILIILDCSYSMDEEINGIRKIDIARQVVNNVLRELPPNINLGLRVYGHKKSFLGIDDCKASELLVPITPNSQQRIYLALRGLDAVGWTPICYSLEQAVYGDFASIPGKKRIILVSDGMETCGGCPCEFAVDLMKKNVNVSIDVIGFDLASEPEAISQLKCVALATHGKFYTAKNAYEFTESLKNSLQVKTKVQGQILPGKQ